MAAQQVREVPVDAAAAALHDLRQVVDRMSTVQAATYAMERGIAPPTNEAGWDLLLGTESDGTELLLWVLVLEIDE